MRRSHSLAASVAIPVLLMFLLLPAVAQGADPSYAGTYVVQGGGTSISGKDGTSAVTVWVEDLGSEARFTFGIDAMGLTTSATGPEQWTGTDKVTVPLSVKNLVVDAGGSITLTRAGDTWAIVGDGSGKALRWDGKGQLAGSRSSPGILLPPIGEQISDMGSAITSGPPETTAAAAAVTAETQAKDPLPFSPATPEPPFTDVEMFLAGGTLILFLFLMLLFL